VSGKVGKGLRLLLGVNGVNGGVKRCELSECGYGYGLYGITLSFEVPSRVTD
jgi:hypothetical protein